MSKRYLVELMERAQSAYDRLPKTVQLRVDQMSQRIELVGLRLPQIRKVSGDERIYLVRVTERIRMVLQVEDDVVRVLDIVNHDQLQRLSNYWVR